MQKETYTCLLLSFFLYVVGVSVAVICWNDKLTPHVGYYIIAGLGGWLVLLGIFDRCLLCHRRRKADLITLEDPPYDSIP